MKKYLILAMCIFCTLPVFAEEIQTIEKAPEETINVVQEDAVEEITATNNKIVVVVQKQPLNERSKQRVILKKNWLGIYIQVNGKVKVNPLTNTYEVD